MNRNRNRMNAFLGLLILAVFVLGCNQLKNLSGGGSLAEANKLIDSANQDLTEVGKIADDNRDKESQISKQINANDNDGAKQSINDALKAIDQGLEKAKSAADKFDKASKLDLDPKVKQYLSLKAQSVQKSVQAFEELKKGLTAIRDTLGSSDKAARDKAKKDTQEASENYDKLMSDSQSLERQADDIAKENPDKIKS
jgi:Mg2+ and Co2+ transporter CorA